MTIRPVRRAAVLGPLTLLLVIAVTGCSGGSSSADSARGGGGASAGARDSAAAEPATSLTTTTPQDDQPVQARAVISTGRVDLVSKDVAGTRDAVSTLLTRYDGFLADERTRTGSGGVATSARLVLRVPSDRFGAVMTGVAKLGRLQDSARTTKDVTTQVIDVEQQVRAQQVGLRRLEVLLGRAKSLRDLEQVP